MSNKYYNDDTAPKAGGGDHHPKWPKGKSKPGNPGSFPNKSSAKGQLPPGKKSDMDAPSKLP